MAHPQVNATTLLFLYLQILILMQSAASNSIGFSLKLISINSPESPFNFGNLSQSERTNKLVEMSKGRGHNLTSSENMRLPIAFDQLLYLVNIRIGTPSIPLFLAMDTGSGLTWTQCEPCENCYHQIPPIYDSRTSHTYRPIPCNHPVCLSDPNLFRCIDEKCVYIQHYASGSSTRGIASEETFEFLPYHRVPIVFGCSNNNLNFPFGITGKIGGILGFGFGATSIIQQLGSPIGYRFSYCHVPLNQASRASGYLRFGNDIVTRGRSFKTTPIVSPPGYNQYFLNLLDVSINGHRIGFPPGTFAIRGDGTGGCIIDSAAPATTFHPDAYQQVIRAFENYYARFRLQRYPFTYRDLHLCYRYDRNFHAYASMTYHFQGADLVVEPEYVHLIDVNRIFCVPIVPTNARSAVGAMHQQNTRFIYDNNNRILQFASEDCLLDAN